MSMEKQDRLYAALPSLYQLHKSVIVEYSRKIAERYASHPNREVRSEVSLLQSILGRVEAASSPSFSRLMAENELPFRAGLLLVEVAHQDWKQEFSSSCQKAELICLIERVKISVLLSLAAVLTVRSFSSENQILFWIASAFCVWWAYKASYGATLDIDAISKLAEKKAFEPLSEEVELLGKTWTEMIVMSAESERARVDDDDVN